MRRLYFAALALAASCGLAQAQATGLGKLNHIVFGLAPLGTRDAASPDMSEAFDFGG